MVMGCLAECLQRMSCAAGAWTLPGWCKHVARSGHALWAIQTRTLWGVRFSCWRHVVSAVTQLLALHAHGPQVCGLPPLAPSQLACPLDRKRCLAECCVYVPRCKFSGASVQAKMCVNTTGPPCGRDPMHSAAVLTY